MQVKAPWPGTVQEIHVTVGDQVAESQELLTIEAMKMLTPVEAPSPGRVTEVFVSAGEFVDEGAPLLALE